LQLGDWINYECIEDNESNANAVHHLVYDWKRIDDRPCVAKVIDEKFVNLHTSIRLLDDIGYESDSLRVPRGYRVAEGDLCDRILVKNTRRVRNSLAEQHQIDVVLEFNDEIYPGFYWIVTAVYNDGISFEIDDGDTEDISETTRNDNKNDQAQSSRSTEEVEKRKSTEKEIVAEMNQPRRVPQLKAEADQRERDDVCSRLLEKVNAVKNNDLFDYSLSFLIEKIFCA
uniref:Ig-like domain-containing protein n=1 Tax=Anisakis simplex TaxID=6269 RepID=A0A0M3J5T1_ANISI